RSEIFLKGKLFERTTPLQYLHNKKNEVVMKDDGVKVKLEEVQCPRELIMTNAPFPEFRGEELLVCRWVWGIIEGMKYQGLIRRVSDAEADGEYRISGHLLRSQWRCEKLNELRFQEELKKQAAIEKSRQRRAEIKAKNAYTIDLERDSFFGGGEKQPSDVSYSRHRPRNPLPNTHLPKGPPKYTFGDAFCGAGGMSRAAEMAHFRVTWGVDCDEPAIQAYQMNFPAATPYHTHVDQLLRTLDGSILVDVLHISPPCQPYSPAHTVAGKNDESNEAALFAITGLLEASRPRFATVEQTDGILHHEFLPALLSPFLDKGFSVAYRVLYGSEYGVPQLRKRLVVIAAGPGETLPSWPTPTHYTCVPEPNLLPTPTIHDIVSQIPLDATEHEFRPYQIPRLPKDPHRQCRTLMAGGSDQEYHPSGLRPFTIREKACLQTFPYDHAFSGSCTTKQRQIGNAVPPLLGRAILNEVRKALEEADEE
ncbi:S-adenosyl-L-methionine-dependent methyltransferase, partial [Terfezia claveryi]